MTASLRELLERGAADHPDTVIVSGAGQKITWRDLHGQARRTAAALTRDGVKAQDRVVFVGKNDPSYFGYLFGCALAGAVPVPLNWRLSATELTAMIKDSGAQVAFTDNAGAPAVEQAQAELPQLGTVVALEPSDRWPTLATWQGPDGPSPDCRDPAGPGPAAQDPAAPDDIAFQLYTSGTTGPPKGAMFTNGSNLRVLLDDISVAWGFTPDDVSLVCMPLFHMGGLAWALAGMARGARQVIVRDFAPGPVLGTMAAEHVTMAFCVPTMLSALSAATTATRPEALRQMVYSGAPISPTGLHAAQQALACDFVQIYGLTEATGAFAQLSAAEHADTAHREWLRSAGRPYPWVEVRAVAPQTGQDPGAPAAPDDIAFQLYTSGTTGPPKGAMFTNGANLRVLLDGISVAWGFAPGDVSLVCMPLFHMGGLAWALAGMARGARQVIVRDFAPGPVLGTMAAEHVTMAFC
ncbi:MAG TPA: AMP-binding protein, partial [Streptosporangiaceae bacterium]